MMHFFLFLLMVLPVSSAFSISWKMGYGSSITSTRRFFSSAGTTAPPTEMIEKLVQQRHQARKMRDFVEADRLKVLLEGHDVVLVDFPYKEGGHTTWSFLHRRPEVPELSLMKLARYVVFTLDLYIYALH